jgi:hypothetical protein
MTITMVTGPIAQEQVRIGKKEETFLGKQATNEAISLVASLLAQLWGALLTRMTLPLPSLTPQRKTASLRVHK